MFGKLIGGLLGYFVAGFPGAALGLLAGHWFDRGLARSFSLAAPGRLAQARDTFFEVSFELLGHLAKADGRVSEAEIASAEALMQKLGITGTRREAAIGLFKQGASQDFDVTASVARFRQDCAGPRQIVETLLALLVGMAYADGSLHARERDALSNIAGLLGITTADFERMIAMVEAQTQFHQHSDAGAGTGQAILAEAYAALGVSPDCSDKDLKKAYRRLMSQHHPDKLSAQGVPDDMMRAATEKAQDIQAAYALIRKTRASR